MHLEGIKKNSEEKIQKVRNNFNWNKLLEMWFLHIEGDKSSFHLISGRMSLKEF